MQEIETNSINVHLSPMRKTDQVVEIMNQ